MYVYNPDQDSKLGISACVPPTWYITTVLMTTQAEPEPAKPPASVNPSVKVLPSEQLPVHEAVARSRESAGISAARS